MSRELKRQLDQLDSAGLLELVVAVATRLEQLSRQCNDGDSAQLWAQQRRDLFCGEDGYNAQ